MGRGGQGGGSITVMAYGGTGPSCGDSSATGRTSRPQLPTSARLNSDIGFVPSHCLFPASISMSSFTMLLVPGQSLSSF